MYKTARFSLTALAILLTGSAAHAGAPDEVFQRIVENWRWQHYWFGKTGIDDFYREGKQVSALIFWNMNQMQPIRGMCSPNLQTCVAYSGIYLDPAPRRMQMPASATARQGFDAFVSSGLSDPAHITSADGLKSSDFQSTEISITLPALNPPDAISRREVSAEERKEAERISRLFRCTGERATVPGGCKGELIFAYHGPDDPYWFVLRSCSEACTSKAETVEMLRRGDTGWEITSAGLVENQKEIERLKGQIERAAMFRRAM